MDDPVALLLIMGALFVTLYAIKGFVYADRLRHELRDLPPMRRRRRVILGSVFWPVVQFGWELDFFNGKRRWNLRRNNDEPPHR